MRAIVLTNSWLSGLQKGLQAGHALVEMSLDAKYHNLYRDWASGHKTLIVLEGGSHLNLSNYRCPKSTKKTSTSLTSTRTWNLSTVQ
jgi:hypothetical protein